MDARPDQSGRNAPVLQAKRDVVAGARHDELRLRVLQHEAGVATDTKLALFVRRTGLVEQAGESLKERALPGTRRTQ